MLDFVALTVSVLAALGLGFIALDVWEARAEASRRARIDAAILAAIAVANNERPPDDDPDFIEWLER